MRHFIIKITTLHIIDANTESDAESKALEASRRLPGDFVVEGVDVDEILSQEVSEFSVESSEDLSSRA